MNSLMNDEAALAVASDASEVAVELIRYVREGRYSDSAPFADDIVAKLAGGLRLILGVEDHSTYLDEAEQKLLDDLGAYLDRFIEGWLA